MRHIVVLMMVIIPSLSLTACLETTSKKGPPVWMENSCPPLKKFPERAASQKMTEGYIRSDTAQYTDCRMRHRALRDYYRARDGRSVTK